MQLDQFNTVVTAQLERCLETLKVKGDEYVFGNDRLEHFKTTATEQETTPKQALWGMASKHITSISGMCRNDTGTKALWDEKITDGINYLLLLRALVEEEYGDKEKRPYQTKKSQLVNLYDLEIGTRFYVCNGEWAGQIVEVAEGRKAIYINLAGATLLLTPESGKDYEIEFIQSETEELENEQN